VASKLEFLSFEPDTRHAYHLQRQLVSLAQGTNAVCLGLPQSWHVFLDNKNKLYNNNLAVPRGNILICEIFSMLFAGLMRFFLFYSH
jgi:hypothetical protein